MRAKRRNAVLVVRTQDFSPQDVGDIPTVILAARVYQTGLHYCAALGVCREFNAAQLADGRPVEEWALLVKWVKPLVSKGGAA
jgi:hypothetical protein